MDPERNSDATSLQGKILRRIRLTLSVFQLVAFWPVSPALMFGQDPPSGSVRVASVSTLEALITDEDTDGDKNINIDDPRVTETSRGDRRFTLRAPDGRPFEIAGTYYLSNLLAVLRVAQESGRDSIDLRYDDLFEAPVEHICRSIRGRYWHGLTRTIDEKGLAHIYADEKSKTVDGYNYVYVPYDDPPPNGTSGK